MLNQSIRRILLATFAAALAATSLLLPAAVSAHAGHDHDTRSDGRMPGMPDFKKVDKTTYRFLPSVEEYEIREPGKPPSYIHHHPERASAEAEVFSEDSKDLTPALSGESEELPNKELQPACRTSGNRIVAVHVYPKVPDKEFWPYPGSYFPETSSEDIKKIMRKLAWKINDQALKSNGGGAGRKLAVDCDAEGNIEVHELATEGDGINESYVPEVEKDGKVFAEGKPTGKEAVKYLIFPNYNGGSGGCQAPLFKTSKKTGNPIASNTSYAIGGPYYFPTGECTLHELFHALGAVQSNAPHANDPFGFWSGHCTDGYDVMCEGTQACPASQGYNTAEKKPLDCGYDDYFNAWPAPSNYLATHWNIAGAENPFLVEVPTEDAPTLTVNEAVNVQKFEVELLGSVNPNGFSTTYHFEYVDEETYEADLPNGFVRAESTPATSAGSGSKGITVKETIEDLDDDTTYRVRLVATSVQGTAYEEGPEFTTEALPPDIHPTVSTGGVTEATALTATVTGSVDTHGSGQNTLVIFEYGTTTAYGQWGGCALIDWTVNWILKQCVPYSSNGGPVEISRVLKGLQPNTTYHYRIGAGNLDAQAPELVLGKDMTFKTTISAPIIESESVDEVQDAKATLRATVNPAGLSSAFRFEYVSESEFQASGWTKAAKAPSSPESIGSGSEGVEVSEPIGELEAATPYRFRVVAENSKGMSSGNGGTFTTWGAWAPQATPNPPAKPEAQLNDVSCASSSLCAAVGTDTYAEKGAAEYWDGAKWEVLDGALGRDATAISCVSTPLCTAVGSSGGQPAAWDFDPSYGEVGSLQAPVPVPAEATDVKISDVSCVAPSLCRAVGSYKKEGKTKTLALHRNVTSWSVKTTPNPESGSAELLSISCDGMNSCTAVGKQGAKTLAMRWNGTAWSMSTTAEPTGAIESRLDNVSCASSSFCMAVGRYKESGGYTKTLTERWDGSQWTIVASPNAAEAKGSSLLGVSCASTTACTAVGRYATKLNQYVPSFVEEEKTLALLWGGTGWSIQASPNPEGMKLPRLGSVACTSAAACTAVGRAVKGTGEGETESVTLGERWNGSAWAPQATPNPPAKPEAQLNDVSCASSSLCAAVGTDTYAEKGAAEYWDGAKWEVLDGALGRDATAISCVSTPLCTAVGSSGGQPAAWDFDPSYGEVGSLQAPVPVPAEATDVKISDVSCVAPSLCRAVGSYKKEGKTKTLALHRNVTSWSVKTTPNPESGSAELLSISCDGMNSCTAVGKQGAKTLAMRWNGTAWSMSTTAEPTGAIESRLDNVSCASSSFCMAVGRYKESGGYTKTLTERWDGSQWTIVASPNAAEAKGSSLLGVSCASTTACTAVGRYATKLNQYVPSFVEEEKTLALLWGGTGWSIQASPNPEGMKLPRLGSVACTSAAACTAVGRAVKGTGEGETESVTLGEVYE